MSRESDSAGLVADAVFTAESYRRFSGEPATPPDPAVLIRLRGTAGATSVTSTPGADVLTRAAVLRVVPPQWRTVRDLGWPGPERDRGLLACREGEGT